MEPTPNTSQSNVEQSGIQTPAAGISEQTATQPVASNKLFNSGWVRPAAIMVMGLLAAKLFYDASSAFESCYKFVSSQYFINDDLEDVAETIGSLAKALSHLSSGFSIISILIAVGFAFKSKEGLNSKD